MERDWLKAMTSRRAVLGGAAGLVGGAMMPMSLIAPVRAADYPALGTFPDGSSGDSVFIGVAVPRTGTYALQGEDELKGIELAIEHLNEGNELIKKLSPKTKKGVLGKEVKHGVADNQAKPNVAVQAQSRFISENKAVMIMGSVSSAVAVALNKLAARDHVIYLPVISGSNDTTGKDCSRYSFRECFYAQTAAAAISPVLIKNLGKDKKVAYLTPDYTYGHTVQKSMEEFVKKGGWTTVTDQVAPLGSSDYSSYLLNIANSGADVFININFGNDAVQSIKQAKQFGILGKQTLVVPYYAPFLAKEVGPDIMEGVYNATDFWWTLEDKYPLAKMFVEAFSKKYGYKPEWGAEAGYQQVAFWANMVETAGTFYPPEVIKAYESGATLQSMVGDVHFRPEDHQLVRPVVIMRGKKKADMKSDDDYFEVLEIVPGDGLMQAPDAFGCKLGSPHLTADLSISRRAALGGAVALAGGSMLPTRGRAAETYPPLGTYPEGSSGTSVFVGIGLPRTGSYARQGEDELMGYELAIAHINEGHALIKTISPKTTKGILGKTVVFGVSDDQAKPNLALQVQSRFVSESKAVLMTGGSSSASAIALNRFAAREKVLYLVGTSGANETTGKDCSRYSFRENFSASMAAAAISPVLVEHIGRDKKVAYLTPDYAFGHSVQESVEAAVKAGGWATVTNQVAPLGSADYSSYLLNIANSGADVFLNINYGGDAVRSIQQAQQFGIMKKQVLGLPYYTPFLAQEVGADVMAGVYSATEFWWTLEDRYPLAKLFVEAFETKYGIKPEWGANAAYLELAFWAAMVEAAGTFYPPEVVKSYEKGATLQSTCGEVRYRGADHQLVRPVLVTRGKAKAAMKGPDDFFDIVEVVPGERIIPSVESVGCKLGSYT